MHNKYQQKKIKAILWINLKWSSNKLHPDFKINMSIIIFLKTTEVILKMVLLNQINEKKGLLINFKVKPYMKENGLDR